MEEEEKGLFDLMFQGSPKVPLWKIMGWKIKRFWDKIRNTKWFFQRIFRSSHASDCDLWGLADHMAPIIAKKLVEFRKINLHGTPMYFVDYDKENYSGWETEEKYEEARAAGEIGGGGHEAWGKAIDEMIFAFEYTAYYNGISERKREYFLNKYNLEDPSEKKPSNRDVGYVYKNEDEDDHHTMYTGDPPEVIGKENKGYKFVGESVHYHNKKLERDFYERAQKGLDLFAKHYWSLWD